jgi:hypothetical protein
MITWTNHDRTAFNEWANTDLGQKFIAYLKENRPKLELKLDINAMAMMGAISTGYEQAMTQIDQMRFIANRRPEPQPFVRDTHKD